MRSHDASGLAQADRLPVLRGVQLARCTSPVPAPLRQSCAPAPKAVRRAAHARARRAATTFDVVVLLAAIRLRGIPRVSTTRGQHLWSIVVGGLYGLILYYINFYGLDAFSPWFIEERDSVSMVSHFVFGAVVASAYRAIRLHWYGGWNEPLASVDE